MAKAAAKTTDKTIDNTTDDTTDKPAHAKASTHADSAHDHDASRDNPKMNPSGTGASNQIKDPSDWVTGGEPMTGAQASYLKTLSEQAHEAEAFDPDIDKAEASKRINHLKEEIGR